VIEDTDLRNDMLMRVRALRVLNDTVADNCIRREIDEHLTRVFLLVRDGHTGNLNGGRGPWHPASEPKMDGVDRLCMAVYGRPAKPRDYIGGANAQMLYDAADLINALTPSPPMSHSFKEPYGTADQLHKANAARTPPNP
jgi:hypothetical protein